MKSDSFGITNGTRQGSVLSPALFGCYINELIGQLRALGVGCYIGGSNGIWCGAASFADDLILMAPTRSAMEAMLDVCEKYGAIHNLVFSTDPSPEKSKSKCLYMCGKSGPVDYPVKLTLYGEDLPFVEVATHLGHELSQKCTMEYNVKCMRGRYIQESCEVIEMFRFAHPSEILRAIKVYCCHFYGLILADLFGEEANKYYRCFKTTVKDIWQVPRACHTYFVHDLLPVDFMPVKYQIISRYVTFFRNLCGSTSKEIRVTANIVGRDVQTCTGRNLAMIQRETNHNPWDVPPAVILNAFQPVQPPDADVWRLSYLKKLLQERKQIQNKLEDTTQIQELINSLCVN